MNTDNLVDRILRSIIIGLLTGIVVALILWVLAVLTPLDLDYALWGTVVGVIAGLYAFLTGKRIV